MQRRDFLGNDVERSELAASMKGGALQRRDPATCNPTSKTARRLDEGGALQRRGVVDEPGLADAASMKGGAFQQRRPLT
ncbi:MAG TPA: hypothetical protein VN969_02335 [Streptosporangiaceae bacterium]|nr:hypothetical protein [Streptosporangiaceae bacterium]